MEFRQLQLIYQALHSFSYSASLKVLCTGEFIYVEFYVLIDFIIGFLDLNYKYVALKKQLKFKF